MKISYLIAFIVLFQNINAQINISFINQELNENIASDIIKNTSFTTLTEFKSAEENPSFTARAAFQYNYEYLSVFIEINSDSIISRDRAYQNGDGFHITIAKPMKNNQPSDEFYVLRFSPANIQKNTYAKISVWYYNKDLGSRLLGEKSKLFTKIQNGKTFYFASIPWKEIHPFHPLSIVPALNLCFVKAIGSTQKNNYFLVHDDKMQSENSSRIYSLAQFENPASHIQKFLFQIPDKNNIQAGDSLKMKIVCVSQIDTIEKITISILTGDNNSVGYIEKTMTLKNGINYDNVILPVSSLAPAGYKIKCKCGNYTDETFLTILSKIEFSKLKDDIQKQNCSIGTKNTLLFILNNISERLSNLKNYETAQSLFQQENQFLVSVKSLEAGIDILNVKTGIFRRAYESEKTKELCPYTIKVPVNFDKAKKYPLLVFLHGSGEDDQGILTYTDLTNKEYIELAPNGRGVSNCFSTQEAQDDILNAIADVVKTYPIDTNRIIIGGFSMGGYGALRTFYESPKTFKAVVLLSGHPSLASKWMGEGHPDFTIEENLTIFKNVPIFVYHNKNDRNCPYELTELLIDKLRKAGAVVTAEISASGGHSLIDEKSKVIYFEWMKKL